MNILELFAPIKTFIFDVDGVLTDGGLLLSEDGHMLRTMHIRDGFAMQLAIRKGYRIWIITGGRSEAVKLRLLKLGITEIHLGVDNKTDFLLSKARHTNTDLDTTLYMGDDIPDYQAMQICGLSCCPADAVTDIQITSTYISPYSGGKGCVRDVIEKVLKLNGHWDLT